MDGSQITPTKDFSVPVGAVQIGWFVNTHTAGGDYVKDIAFEVLAPDELADEDEDVVGFADWRVNLRRFLGECEHLIGFMNDYKDAPVKPVCFFDGSLVVSFVQHMQPDRQRQYVQAVMALVAASESTRVPLVGYIDTSYANDLAAMLDAFAGRVSTQRISDGVLLRERMAWGDRATAWICAHVPPGSHLLVEHWDDPLPIVSGREGLACGFDYAITTLPVYDPDTPEKAADLAARLAEADYVILSSSRLHGVIPRLPERYPVTSRYYRLLFAESLGYELVHYEATYPRVLGWDLAHDLLERAGLPAPRLWAEGEGRRRAELVCTTVVKPVDTNVDSGRALFHDGSDRA